MAQSKEWRQQYYLKNKERIKVRVKKYQSEHKEWVNKKSREWNKKNPEKVRAIQKIYGERNKAEISARRKKFYAQNRERLLLRDTGYRIKSGLKLKKEVLSYYGKGKCQCCICGMDNLDCLSLDHINNNGADHRKTLKYMSIYRFLKRQSFPNGYQTLCMNCQWIKKAEHQQQRRIPSRL
uniref:Uncharacterized protein n=1 Tax=viral metagenome TaxID=1070528 RepID=A0A6H2A2Z9_9ZZZZ